MLFDWLVVSQIVAHNPAHAVRGPKHVVKKSKTPVLSTEEMHDLFDGFPADSLVALRDRALLATMAYTFARVGAVLALKVKDYYIQGRRSWLRLHEKGGKANEMPCHHALEQFLDEYIEAAKIGTDPEGPLFRTWRSAALQRRELDQSSVHRMVRRRLRQAGIRSRVKATFCSVAPQHPSSTPNTERSSAQTARMVLVPETTSTAWLGPLTANS